MGNELYVIFFYFLLINFCIIIFVLFFFCIVLDASGSVLVGGFQQGMFVSLGEFDQCLEIESDPTENPNIIYGQYCLLKPVVPLPENFNQDEPIAETRMPRVRKFLNDEYIDTYMGLYKFMQRTFLRVGLCLPHKCERQSVENAINRSKLLLVSLG